MLIKLLTLVWLGKELPPEDDTFVFSYISFTVDYLLVYNILLFSYFHLSSISLCWKVFAFGLRPSFNGNSIL